MKVEIMVKSTSSKVTPLDSRVSADRLHVGDVIVQGFSRDEYLVLEIASTGTRGELKVTVSERGDKTAIYSTIATPADRFEVTK